MDRRGDNMTGLKRFNRSSALRIIHGSDFVSRKQLAEKMGLTPAAVTKIISEMIEEGLVKEGNAISCTSAGRREIELSLNPVRYCALGMFINIDRAVLSAVWLDGTVIFSKDTPLVSPFSGDETVRHLCQELIFETDKYINQRDIILGVGIAVRGIVSPDGEILADSFGAFKEKNYPLKSKVEEYTSLKAVMANNVRALFSANTHMSKSGEIPSSFFLRCEYGIGASVSFNGKIWSGASQQCSEIGHIPVVRTGGKPCYCGKCGCLETVASPKAMVEDAKELLSDRGKDASHLTIDDVLALAQSGDSDFADIVDRAVVYLASALKSVIYSIDPNEIVLYGKVFDNRYYLAKLTAEMEQGIDSRHRVNIFKSPYNLSLEDKAAGLIMVESFIDSGGIVK